jgi:hypothetical protein
VSLKPKRSLLSFVLRSKEIEFKIAQTAAEKEAAYKLVYSEYLKRGFIREQNYPMYASIYQLLPDTTTFIGVHKGEVVVTISTICDSAAKLPSDRLFGDVFDRYRKPGRNLAEFSMLSTKKGFFGKGAYSLQSYRKMQAVFSLFKIATQHAYYVKNVTDIVMTVNPCYQKIYKYNMMEQIGGLRQYKEFNSNPALAFRLDLVNYATPQIQKHAVPRFLLGGNPIADEILRAEQRFSMPDLFYLFVEQSDLASRLTPEQRTLLAQLNPAWADWFEALPTMLLYHQKPARPC